jgi:hypothetical protein
MPSQPGDGVRLEDVTIGHAVVVEFTADLRATAANGKKVERQITIPVEVVPG